MRNLNIELLISLLVIYVKAKSNCWSESLGYSCCERTNHSYIKTDKYGKWSVENNKWCGIVEEEESTTKKQIEEEKIIQKKGGNQINNCWSLKFGYPCCERTNHSYIETNTDGSWALENNNWCGIPVEEQKPKEESSKESSKEKSKQDCWSMKLSIPYSCCKDKNTEVIFTDDNGKWGVENNDWCGISNEENSNQECWSMKLSDPIPCCKDKNTNVVYYDEDGKWGVENNDWCGIVNDEKSENPKECWALNLGYDCCKNPKTIPKMTDKSGDWGMENGIWCGLPKQEIDETSTKENCWAMRTDNMKCCKYDNIIPNYKTNSGFWHRFYDETWCGYRNDPPKWNDRASIKETKDKWEKFKSKWGKGKEYDVNNFESLSVFPGEDESQLNFGWYSKSNGYAKLRFGLSKNLSKSHEIKGKSYKCRYINGVQYYCNQVTITGLESKSTYYYQRNLNGNWENPIKISTQDPDNFRFVFLGDPQIGASKDNYSMFTESRLSEEEGLRNDAFNWNMTIYNSYQMANKASLILSAGDNADSGQKTDDPNESEENKQSDLLRQEREYSTLLLPQLMQQVPFAAATGNHESHSPTFRYHFNTPNSYTETRNETTPAYSYFFKHNNVLVVVLESNFGTEQEYNNLLKKANNAYPNVDWRIALFHHDIYSNGATHSGEERVIELRKMLTSMFDQYKIDLVINGHDHMYAASHFVKYDENKKEKYMYDNIEVNKTYKNHEGTIFITANCSTGSKLYDTIGDTDYIYHYNQTYTSTFGILDFKKENGKTQLSITSYDVDTLKVTDGPYRFEKNANNVSPPKCWSTSIGYPCCTSKNTEVITIDNDGKWGVENNEWCGIPN